MRLRFVFPLLALSTPFLSAAEVDFAREVLPILSNKCFACHGPDAKKKDLRLDSLAAATEDLGGYQAINPDDPEDSELLFRIHDKDDPMPPEDAEKQLTDSEREILTQWVKQGGEYAQHWSFVPPVKKDAPGGSAIDGWIAEGLRKVDGLKFAPEADRATLARRAALVLTGLPPEPDHLANFLADDRPDAYEHFVDGLMTSPRFGEHQARYWLDAVRYGDTHGLHLDNRRGIFPYRDWVVRAFNENLPLDDFLTWQLAGDLLPEPTMEQLVATGFVRMNPTTSEGGVIPAEFQAKNNFDRTETLGTVLLGMTMSCARCHTHKYDPITQTEYYQLLAFFNSTAEKPLDGNKYDYAPALKVPADQHAWTVWNELDTALDGLLKEAGKELAADQRAAWQKTGPEEKLTKITDSKGPFAKSELQPRALDLKKRRDEAQKAFTTTLIAKELSQPRETKLLLRGEYSQPTGEPLVPDVPAIMSPLPEDVPRNRLGLAQWLTARGQPLVARVLVNQIWQRVFGDGLVRTPEDFGLQGEQPTHPELLDWLAVELHDSGWDHRHMLRLMVTSRAFKQESARRKGIDDPENRLVARGPSHRLDAEVLRDMGLWASELLDDHMGGPGVKPYQPPGLWSALMHPASNTKKYEQDTGEKLYRRSLYVYWKRTSPHPMMTLFDAPDRESSCVRRSRASTPLQSLALLNETQRIEMARKLAERLLHEADDEAERLDLLFTLVASRPARNEESKVCLDLLATMQKRYQASVADAQALLATGEAARDTALDAAEHAAWTQVAITVLASDIAIMLY